MAEINEAKNIKDIKGDKDDYDPRRKREVIKTVLIVFLGILLLLTFFSNTIMNKSLSEISTERTTSGKLTERIRGSGLVESNQSYGVTIEGNKVVDTVKVKSGQQVKKDDVLLIVGTGESEELNQAQTELDTLELEYNKALLTPSADYTSENQAIKNAREDLAAAIEQRDKLKENQGNLNSEKEEYKNNKSQLNYYTKLQTKLQAVITAVDTDDYTAAPAEYTGDLLERKGEADRAFMEYTSSQQIYTALLGSGVTDDDDDAKADGENAKPREAAAPIASEAEIAAAKQDMDDKKAAYDEAQAAYDDLKYELRGGWTNELTDAEDNIEYYTGLVEEYESGSAAGDVTVEALDAEIKEKQRTLEDLITALEKTQKENDTQNKLDSLDLDAKKKEIDKLKEKIKTLKEENETTEIKSKYSGVVSSVNVKAGDETVPDMELITIDISDEGYTVQITVDGQKSTKIKKGVAAEVVNNWNGNIEAVLTDIRNDTTANSKNRILVFSVSGDVDSGTYIDLSIPCGSGNYDAIVPKSAVYSDNNGSFVLTVVSKSSPLGNRYYAQRVPVEVVVSDELSSAVTGDISYGDYVITAASKPVSPGDQVRMKDK